MFSPKIKLIPMAAVLALSLAPTAHAQERDSGIGLVIAAQGDQALEVIRADAHQTALRLTKALLLPSRPESVTQGAGAATAVAATLRSAE